MQNIIPQFFSQVFNTKQSGFSKKKNFQVDVQKEEKSFFP